MIVVLPVALSMMMTLQIYYELTPKSILYLENLKNLCAYLYGECCLKC